MFKAKIVNGTPIETDEAKPLWFKVNELPYESMWKDDRVWLPLLLKGQKFHGKFWFDKDYTNYWPIK